MFGIRELTTTTMLLHSMFASHLLLHIRILKWNLEHDSATEAMADRILDLA